MRRWTGLFTYACFTCLFACICRSFEIKQFFHPVSWAQTLWSSFTESTGSPPVVRPSTHGIRTGRDVLSNWKLKSGNRIGPLQMWQPDIVSNRLPGCSCFPFPNALFGSFQMGMRNESHGQVKKTSDVNYSCATRNPRLLPFCNEQRNSCKLIYCRLEAFVKVQSSITPPPIFLSRQLWFWMHLWPWRRLIFRSRRAHS